MSDATPAPAKVPTLMLLTPEHIKAAASADDAESVVSTPPTCITTPEIVLVDPCVLKIVQCLPYKISKQVESTILSILQNSWSVIAAADKGKLLKIFETVGGNRQVSSRLRNIVNEITKDGRIDMEDLPHITELIITLLDIFQDLKLPAKSDHLIVTVFEFLVMIIVASSLGTNAADELEKWSATIRAAMKLVQLQVRRSGCCNCC